jgi:hypothetical protein
MLVESPDRAPPEQKVFCLLIDAEKVQIIHLQKNEYSWATVNLPQFL